MKANAVLPALLAILYPSLAVAGGVSGRITDGQKPIPSLELKVVISSGQSYSAWTDKDGAYGLYVPSKGACTFQVKYHGQTPSTKIISYDSAVRYDFVLVRSGNGYKLQEQ